MNAMVTEQNKPKEADRERVSVQAGLNKTRIFLNAVIGLLLIAVCYLACSFYFQYSSVKNDETMQEHAHRTVQLDVLNGCGVPGTASKCTEILRQRGFDVVEIKNYSSFNVPNTIIIDRIGDRKKAQRVAATLGVNENNIIQQINPDYFVDVSVVIGKDYINLKPMSITEEKSND